MKKLTDLLFSTVIAVAMVSSAASAYSAENFEYDSVTLGESHSVQQICIYSDKFNYISYNYVHGI